MLVRFASFFPLRTPSLFSLAPFVQQPVRTSRLKLNKLLKPWQQMAVHGFGSIKQGMDVCQQGGLRKPFGRLAEVEIAEAARHYFVRMLIRSKRPHGLKKAEADLGQESAPPIA